MQNCQSTPNNSIVSREFSAYVDPSISGHCNSPDISVRPCAQIERKVDLGIGEQRFRIPALLAHPAIHSASDHDPATCTIKYIIDRSAGPASGANYISKRAIAV